MSSGTPTLWRATNLAHNPWRSYHEKGIRHRGYCQPRPFTVCPGGGRGGGGAGRKAHFYRGLFNLSRLTKLAGYRAGTYGSARKATMEGMVKKYTPEELKSVVEYIKTL